MDVAVMNRSKRRRSSDSTDDIAVVKRLQVSPAHTYQDTYISGSANVQFGDRIYVEGRGKGAQQEVQRLQTSLQFSGMHGRYEAVREAAENTCEWVLDPNYNRASVAKREKTASFFQWFHDGEGTFWVSGKPGSGKSTLMKYLTEHVVLETPKVDSEVDSKVDSEVDPEVDHLNLVVLSYFFWINGDDLQRSVVGCMRSLLWQLLQNSSTKDPTMQTCRLYFNGAWTESVLRDVLSTVMDNAKHPTAIFLDGLDESSDHDETIAMLDVFKTTARVKLCVSSRPDLVFVDALSLGQSFKLQDLNSEDIQQVIRSKFLNDVRVRALAERWGVNDHSSALEDLADTIGRKSEGVFLWVHLVIKDLLRGITQRDDLSMLSRRLHRLPNDIYELYKNMLKRTQCDYELYKNETQLLLALALHRPFPIIEFCFAANEVLRKKYMSRSIFNKTGLDNGADIDCEAVMAQAHAYTAGLLEVSHTHPSPINWTWPEGGYTHTDRHSSLQYKLGTYSTFRVVFIHRTAIDFLRNTAEGISLLNKSPTTDANTKRICLETRLISHMILPGTLGRCVSVHMAQDMLICQGCDDDDTYTALRTQGLFVLNSLLTGGLLLPDKSTWATFARHHSDTRRLAHPFPSSDYAPIDLVPVLIKAGRFRAVEMWLDDYKCMNDSEYMTKLLVVLLLEHGSQIKESQHVEAFVKTFIERGADVRQNLTTQIGEVISPIGAALAGWPTDCLVRPKLTDADHCIRNLPCCYDCHFIWYREVYRHRTELWGTFRAIRQSKPSRKEKFVHVEAQTSSSGKDRIFVIACAQENKEKESPRLLGVSEADSLLLINLYAKATYGSGILEHWGNNDSDPLLKGGRCLVNTICARSPVLTFAAAMERLGKSQETIQKFYTSEAERMAREHEWRQKGWKEWYWGPLSDQESIPTSALDKQGHIQCRPRCFPPPD